MAGYDEDTNVITKNKPKKPSMYTLVFLNDDFTPMEFVVHVLVSICHMSLDDANVAMMKVHNDGKAAVGRYTWEIAEDKAYTICSIARRAGYPLLVQPEEIE